MIIINFLFIYHIKIKYNKNVVMLMKKDMIKALKIAIACCLSIFVAEFFQLDFSSSAGITALLTITDSRKKTLTLAMQRLLSFIVSIIIAIFVFQATRIHWITFGVYIFFVVWISYYFNWHGTISVNAVMGTHILFSPEVTSTFIMNEFYIIFIGSAFAILLNMIIPKKTYKELISEDIQYIENSFISFFKEINHYLINQDQFKLDENITKLENYIENAMQTAIENNENINQEESKKYVHYCDIRLEQLYLFENISFKFKQIDNLSEVDIINLTYLINEIIDDIALHKKPHHHKNQCRLIKDTFFHDLNNIEDKAILYGVVLDLEEFIEKQIQLLKLNK